MTAKQLTHIRVLLVGPPPHVYIAHHMPNLDPKLISSEDDDPADAAKDQTEVATGVAEDKSKDVSDTKDVAKQTWPRA